jgi:hypothetical protein
MRAEEDDNNGEGTMGCSGQDTPGASGERTMGVVWGGLALQTVTVCTRRDVVGTRTVFRGFMSASGVSRWGGRWAG